MVAHNYYPVLGEMDIDGSLRLADRPAWPIGQPGLLETLMAVRDLCLSKQTNKQKFDWHPRF